MYDVYILSKLIWFLCENYSIFFSLSLPLILLQVIVVEESSQVTCPITTKLVLDEDEETKEPILQVHRNLVTKLKPHQVDGKDKANSIKYNEWLWKFVCCKYGIVRTEICFNQQSDDFSLKWGHFCQSSLFLTTLLLIF